MDGLTDCHCHINSDSFANEIAEVVERARQAGVGRIIVAGYDLESSANAVKLARQIDIVEAVVGIHPEECARLFVSDAAKLDDMVAEAGDVISGIGETGLDYYWGEIPREEQRLMFEWHIECAKRSDLPLIVHCRDAEDDVMETLLGRQVKRAYLHSFTGSLQTAQKAASAGYFLGVGGIATFKKNESLRDILRLVPINQILLETDSPYLAPQAKRGKRNEPAYTSYIAEAVAPLWSVSADELAKITTNNASRLFGPAKH